MLKMRSPRVFNTNSNINKRTEEILALMQDSEDYCPDITYATLIRLLCTQVVQIFIVIQVLDRAEEMLRLSKNLTPKRKLQLINAYSVTLYLLQAYDDGHTDHKASKKSLLLRRN